jgi:hypothetical protein
MAVKHTKIIYKQITNHNNADRNCGPHCKTVQKFVMTKVMKNLNTHKNGHRVN